MAREFNQAIAETIGVLSEIGVHAYADDITIFGSTLDEALLLLEETLKRLRANGYVLNHKKVKLF